VPVIPFVPEFVSIGAAAPQDIPCISFAPALRIFDPDDRHATIRVRIPDQILTPASINALESKIVRGRRQRLIAIQPAPPRRAPRYRAHESLISPDFHLRNLVNLDLECTLTVSTSAPYVRANAVFLGMRTCWHE
jgi:hypothetical protein